MIISTPTASRWRPWYRGARNLRIDFIDACAWIKENLPGVHISGGISNVSFCSAATTRSGEAIHAVFLFHAIKAGLDRHRQRGRAGVV